MKPALYLASASFIPQGADPGRSGLANLAGQFGVVLPSSSQSLSPDFYARLLRSRELLLPIVSDTFAVPEIQKPRIAFLDLIEIKDQPSKRREEKGIRELTKLISATVSKTTGVVEFSVATRWPNVSLAIARKLLSGVDDFNRRTRQEQAAAERKFVEGRLVVAGEDLRAAEDRLEEFLRNNRQFASSPDLSFQRDRLLRNVSLKQQVFTSLTQSYEEVRIREVRDTPVITVIESPAVPTVPEPRGRIVRILLGLLLGGLIGSLFAFMSETMARRRHAGDPTADEFVGALHQMKGDMLGRVKRMRAKIRP
jgi:uncharacterized protein involved in exopolysaccharide biosynthesis